MSSPIVIHMHRPYASEEEYITHERFSIEAKSMLLIDQPALPIDTAVVFDVTLENGQKPIRAEARVVGHVEPDGERPGGLRVRFKRFGAATKAFIDRAVNGTVAPPIATSSVAPVPDAAPRLDVAPAREVTAASVPEPAVVSNERVNVAASTAKASTVAPPAVQGSEANDTDEASGIHKKTGAPSVVAPPNREALLARLRGRRVS